MLMGDAASSAPDRPAPAPRLYGKANGSVGWGARVQHGGGGVLTCLRARGGGSADGGRGGVVPPSELCEDKGRFISWVLEDIAD